MLIACGLARSTRARYNTGMDHYMRCCGVLGMVPLPATELNLLWYTAWRFCESLVLAKTVSCEITGILSHHIERGIYIDRSGFLQLSRMLKGFKRLRGECRRERRPATDDILRRWFVHLQTSTYKAVLERAAISLEKCAMFRNAEIAPNEVHVRGLEICMTQFVRREGSFIGLVITFKKSKVNQYRKLEYACVPCICPHVCAVHETLRLLSWRRNLRPQDALLCHADGRSFTAQHMSALIKRLCRQSGLNSAEYSPHSLRAGGCTDYIAWGVEVMTVKDLGRWKCLQSLDPYRKLQPQRLVQLTFDTLNSWAH